MANSSNDSDDNALAYAAVSLFANPSRGAAPQWQELSAWRDGTLDAERSAEILSHVANDPDCFQQWLDIVEAEHWVEEEANTAHAVMTEQASPPTADNSNTPSNPNLQSSSPSPGNSLETGIRWLRSLFHQPPIAYGGAFAAIMLAILIVPLMREGDIATLQQQADRSLDTYIASEAGLPASAPIARSTRNLGGLFDDLSQTDVARRHFQYGMQLVATQLSDSASTQWQAWNAELPSSPIDCSNANDQTNCKTVAQDITTLGQWTLLNYSACQQRGVFNNDAYWSQQLAFYKQLSSTNTLTDNPLFGPVLKPLDSKDPDALCTIVSQLLAAGA